MPLHYTDHYPVAFHAHLGIDRVYRQRRLTKTILQSNTLAETAKMYYAVALRDIEEELVQAGDGTKEDAAKAFDRMEKDIKRPCEEQANKRRRHAPPHWNGKFIKLLARKKLMYDRMKWKPNRRNRREYIETCRETQCYERQLRRERQRINKQRIQSDPGAEIALEIRRPTDMRKRQEALEKLSGQQLAPRAYAVHMKEKLDASTEEEICLENVMWTWNIRRC